MRLCANSSQQEWNALQQPKKESTERLNRSVKVERYIRQSRMMDEIVSEIEMNALLSTGNACFEI